jgi:NCS1 family nucleobase:cation symporter-1
LFTTLLFQPFMLVRYTHGFNLRAIGAFVLALIPNLPGFAAKVNDKAKVPISATYI